VETTPANPEEIRDVAEFMTALRDLRQRSGLTLRQLESAATARGTVLARSTVADMLRRPVLPRAELVGAFLRACGEEPRLAAWMKTYQRLTVGPLPAEPEPDDIAEADDLAARPAAPPRSSSVRTRSLVALGLTGCVVAAVAIYVASAAGSKGDGTPGTSTTASSSPPVLAVPATGSWVAIHPSSAPELCVTAGRDRARRHGSEVAVQAPCSAPGPRTLLRAAVGDLVHVAWEHPQDKALGCLTIIDVNGGRLVEPWDACSAERPQQLFRVERFGTDSGGYRFRQPDSGDCLAVGGTGHGAEITPRQCADQADQRFLIDPLGENPSAAPKG
jgi:hypothetical protein